MADEKKPDDQKGSENKTDNPIDNSGSPDKSTQHWQKIAEERRLEIERIKTEFQEKDQTQNKNEVEELRGRLKAIEIEKEKSRLEETYPDIEPDLLLGKTETEQKEIAERQRIRIKNFTDKAIDINAPQYSQNDLDKQIDELNKSSKQPLQKAQEVLRLNRLKRENT